MLKQYELENHTVVECQPDGKTIGELHGSFDLRTGCPALSVTSKAIISESTCKPRFGSVELHFADHHCTHLGLPIPLSLHG
jgi:hypothetical protein